MADNTCECSPQIPPVANAFGTQDTMLFQILAKMISAIEQTSVEDPRLFPPAPCFWMMIWAMNFRGHVSSASPKLCFFPLQTVCQVAIV